MNNQSVAGTVLALLTVLLSGCFRNEAPIRFYLLTADVPSSASETSSPERLPATVIGVGPVQIPEYLNRPQMVIGVDEYQYRLDEEHRWAERLDQNIERALLLSLSKQLDGTRLVPHPWPTRQEIDYQTRIEVLKLHRDGSGQSQMSAQWSIETRSGTLAAKQFACTRPVPKDGLEALVKVQSECLTRLSMDIASTLRRLITDRRNDAGRSAQPGRN
ncbi:MAG: PqiC family protein [Gammaproteobacteria bacterium]